MVLHLKRVTDWHVNRLVKKHNGFTVMYDFANDIYGIYDFENKEDYIDFKKRFTLVFAITGVYSLRKRQIDPLLNDMKENYDMGLGFYRVDNHEYLDMVIIGHLYKSNLIDILQLAYHKHQSSIILTLDKPYILDLNQLRNAYNDYLKLKIDEIQFNNALLKCMVTL